MPGLALDGNFLTPTANILAESHYPSDNSVRNAYLGPENPIYDRDVVSDHSQSTAPHVGTGRFGATCAYQPSGASSADGRYLKRPSHSKLAWYRSCDMAHLGAVYVTGGIG